MLQRQFDWHIFFTALKLIIHWLTLHVTCSVSSDNLVLRLCESSSLKLWCGPNKHFLVSLCPSGSWGGCFCCESKADQVTNQRQEMKQSTMWVTVSIVMLETKWSSCFFNPFYDEKNNKYILKNKEKNLLLTVFLSSFLDVFYLSRSSTNDATSNVKNN